MQFVLIILPDGTLIVAGEWEEKKRGRKAEKKEEPAGFDAFWAAYPKKAGKPAARRAWNTLKPKPDEPLVKSMLAALARHAASEQWKREGGRFIPHPATWLNQRRWEDEQRGPGYGLGRAGRVRPPEGKYDHLGGRAEGAAPAEGGGAGPLFPGEGPADRPDPPGAAGGDPRPGQR